MRHQGTRSITASVSQSAAACTIHRMAVPALKVSPIWLRRMGEGHICKPIAESSSRRVPCGQFTARLVCKVIKHFLPLVYVAVVLLVPPTASAHGSGPAGTTLVQHVGPYAFTAYPRSFPLRSAGLC